MLNVAPSLLLRMYVGETPRLTKALFTLAAKLQPCLIFIDEADSLFCARSGSDHAVDRKIVTECKHLFHYLHGSQLPGSIVSDDRDAQRPCLLASLTFFPSRFIVMQLWDELLREHADVVIVGATNRPQDLDPAILRRFERSFLVPAPDLPARKDVLSKLLRGVELDADFDSDRCAQCTDGYTASDLAAVCRAAVLQPIKEQAKKKEAGSSVVRPLRTEVSLVVALGPYHTRCGETHSPPLLLSCLVRTNRTSSRR
jgi:SpoVK/Ycf46/Vps4 family AAA+-type ATPase